MNRRDFFRRLLAGGIDQTQKAAESTGAELGRTLRQIGVDPGHFFGAANGAKPAINSVEGADSGGPPPGPRYLRPPGARVQVEFADACSRCAACVKACPAQCIQLDEGTAGGLPFILARESPCVVCDSLACMDACPTDALVMVADPSQIDMGAAEVNHQRCLRSPGEAKSQAAGEDCRICVQQCPVGESAIRLHPQTGRVSVEAGCVGCGVCERVCPTEPPSIWVVPSRWQQTGTIPR